MDESRLRAIPLFAGLKKKERRAVAQQADEVDVEAGCHLVREGEFAYEFFAIEEGTAEVTREGGHVADLGPGDFFGEIGLMEPDRERTASVVATSPMQVIVMTGPDFRRVSREMPHVAAQIQEAIHHRTRQAGLDA
jgi:CRP/FNR family transcriptional regulator, cyclic AMP receptor protein